MRLPHSPHFDWSILQLGYTPACSSDFAKAQIQIDKMLTEHIEQIARQDHAEWSAFPDRLKAHAAALLQQSERLTR